MFEFTWTRWLSIYVLLVSQLLSYPFQEPEEKQVTKDSVQFMIYSFLFWKLGLYFFRFPSRDPEKKQYAKDKLCTENGVPITVLIIPASGAQPRLLRLPTVNVLKGAATDWRLHHVPYMRRFWDKGNGWLFRDMARIDITNHQVPILNGCYFGFKSYALDDLPKNQHAEYGIFGDACLAKMAPERFAERGQRIVRVKGEDIVDYRNQLPIYAVYDNMPREIIETELWKELLVKLAVV